MTPQKFNIGDEVRFKNIVEDNYIPKFYTQEDGIPLRKLIHGDTRFRSNEGKIVDIYNDYYIVQYVSTTGQLVALGFRKESLEYREGSLEYKDYYRCEFDEAGTKGVINKPMKLNLMMRRLLNADIKKLIKAGLINGNLLLTDEGKNALYALLVETHKKELVEIAKEIIAEKKEDRE